MVAMVLPLARSSVSTASMAAANDIRAVRQMLLQSPRTVVLSGRVFNSLQCLAIVIFGVQVNVGA